MPEGPGKYDAEASRVRDATRAEVVMVLVIGGDRGSGFSLQFAKRMQDTPAAKAATMRLVASGLSEVVKQITIEADKLGH